MAANYTIISQVPRTRSYPGGVFVKVFEVTFTALPSQQTGVVDVPVEGYSTTTVAEAIAPVAAALNAVQVS